MKFIRVAACALISLCSTAYALPQKAPPETTNILQERLKKAKSGDFFVAEANKMVSLLIVRSISPTSLILEEITAPSNSLNPRPASWSEWIKKRAPGHTSWSMIEIDLQTHQLMECFSFTRSAWMQLSPQDSFIPTLLSLSLQPVAEKNLRRIGPHPMDGEPDHRQVWKPPLVINGRQVPDVEFAVFEALWPHDGSQLAGNKVSIYFDRSNQTPFPAWIQIETAHAAGSLRIIDAGMGMPALHRKLPRRVPEFVGSPQKTENGMRLSLKSPKYYRSFDLFAIDVTTRDKQLLPITHSLVGCDGEILQIEIDMEELQNMLTPEHRYTWLLVPTGYSESYTESTKSFLWKTDF